MKGGRKKSGLKKLFRRAKKGVNKASRAVHKASRNRFVKAARRAADYGLKVTPYVGNVYAAADQTARGIRAATRGKLGQFIAKEGAEGLFETLAPQAAAAVSAEKAKRGVTRALVEGKGHRKGLLIRRRIQK